MCKGGGKRGRGRRAGSEVCRKTHRQELLPLAFFGGQMGGLTKSGLQGNTSSYPLPRFPPLFGRWVGEPEIYRKRHGRNPTSCPCHPYHHPRVPTLPTPPTPPTQDFLEPLGRGGGWSTLCAAEEGTNLFSEIYFFSLGIWVFLPPAGIPRRLGAFSAARSPFLVAGRPFLVARGSVLVARGPFAAATDLCSRWGTVWRYRALAPCDHSKKTTCAIFRSF